jgi:hypothetical protein
MNKVYLIAMLIAISLNMIGCCEAGSEPGAPYGNADDVSRYSGSEGYASITYTYYCRNGQYVSVTYIRKDDCSDYEKESEFTSSGICPSKTATAFKGLPLEKQLYLLSQQGHIIDTIECYPVDYSNRCINH